MDGVRKKKILYGKGREASKFIYNYECKHGRRSFREDFIFVLDNNSREGEQYRHLNCYKLEKAPDMRGCFIVIAIAGVDNYLTIKRLLEKRGYIEYSDFIYYTLYEKKQVVINANCHGGILIKYLMNSGSFREQYGIYPMKEIHFNDAGISEDVLKNTDLYIHQRIKNDNKYGYQYSDERCLRLLNKKARDFCIPNLWPLGGKGFFPTQIMEGNDEVRYDTELLFYRDLLIDEAYNSVNNPTLEHVCNYIQTYEYDCKEIKNNFNKALQKIKADEQHWDIKISDYIEANYKRIPMFIDVGHPSFELMQYMCIEICKNLGFNDIEDVNTDAMFPLDYQIGYEVFMWPQVKKILGIEYSDEPVRLNRGTVLNYINPVPCCLLGMTNKEYIREYIYMFWDDLLPDRLT